MQQHRRGETGQHSKPTVASNPTSTQPPLVGRAVELDRLMAVLARAADGQGGAIFLAGEAGIGKTRLSHELLALARAQGNLTFEGRAYSLEGRLAYAPILAAFGPFLRGLDSSHQARLIGGLPDLGRLFTGLRLPALTPLSDPALEKTRLFEAVARLIERLTNESPLVLFIDDLHWADPASIELIHYITRGLAGQAVLLLGTYRPEDVDAARGLRSLVTSLRRAGLSEEIVISRLDASTVADLADGVLGSRAPGELLALLNDRAGGTPLFVEALIRALIDAGSLVPSNAGWTLEENPANILPSGVRDLMLERLERLSLTERNVLDLIVVSPEAVAHDVLHAASGLEDDVLLGALHRLRGNGLVAEELVGSDVRHTLTHPLIQDVAYTQLSEVVRRRIHAAYASTLERLRPDDLERLAHHYHLAGTEVDPARALDVLLAAGERAYDLYANDQAARHFSAALALVRDGRRIELFSVLLERLGEAWERVGETAAAIEVWSEALIEHERAENATAAARLYRRLALAEWDRGRFESTQAHLEAGLRVLSGDESSPARADLLHAQVIVLGRTGEYDQVIAVAEELIALAEQLGSPRVRAEAHLAQIGPRSVRWDLDGAFEEARHGLVAADLDGEPLLIQRAHDQLAQLAYAIGEHVLSRQHAEHSLALARRLGAPTLELFPRNRLVGVDLMSGDWDDARRGSSDVLAMARRLGSTRGTAGALSLRAFVHVYHGDLDLADACLAEAHEVFGGVGAGLDRNIFSQVVAAETMLALERGDADGALAAADRLGEMPAAAGFPLIMLALIAEAQAAAGMPECALAMARDLVARAPADTTFAAALASRVEGFAHSISGQSAAALSSLEQSTRAFEAAAMPFERARTRLEWAALAKATDMESAAGAAQESLAIFESLGAQRYEKRSRQLLSGLGVRPRGLPRPRSGASPLSPRELEVVRLVADGLTNAEVAERLFISPRTVTTHLDRIYSRLEINSRTTLVRYAIEAGLLPPTDDV